MKHLPSFAALLLLGMTCTAPLAVAQPAAGPLRVHPTNPRYFTDGTQNAGGTLRAVYLNRERCAHHAIEWIVHASRHTPSKPVINLEAMYDGGGDRAWQAMDARAAAWRSWLSGAKGYTYGAGDVPPKTPPGTGGGIWKWVTDPEKPDYWKRALQWDSSRQMQHLHDFLSDIEWWRLEPAHDLIRNQPDKPMSRRMVLAKTAAGDLAVAYLPDNECIEIDLSTLSEPLAVRWFDPVHGHFDRTTHRAKNAGVERFTAPSKGEWVLLLQRESS